MQALTPYLSLNGNTAEAMAFYQKVFGGQLTVQKISEAPFADKMPPAMQDKILHAMLVNGNFQLAASDMMQQPEMGNAYTIMVHPATEAETHSLFEAMSEGADVKDPLGIKFWGDLFGMLIDKFGVQWQFVLEKFKMERNA